MNEDAKKIGILKLAVERARRERAQFNSGDDPVAVIFRNDDPVGYYIAKYKPHLEPGWGADSPSRLRWFAFGVLAMWIAALVYIARISP